MTVETKPEALAKRVRVIVVGMLKGGSGKTTTAWFIALWWAIRGYRVLILDGDAVSQTAFTWATKAKARGYKVPITVERYPYDDIAQRITEALEEFDIVIADMGGAAAVGFAEAVSKADLVIMPISPSDADGWRIPATFSAAEVGAAKNPRPVHVMILLTKVVKNSKILRKTRAELEENDFPVATTEITTWLYYSESAGHVPSDLAEYNTLMDEIDKELTSV
ncbi:ParA family protein [Embleya sp. NPDC005971]|uniref:ParA family protein n=1 Tax=Embleya sp. NPDC005971 TaxID=3156724 RepID=UPI00340499E2